MSTPSPHADFPAAEERLTLGDASGGELEAGSDEEARRLAAERWPGLRLLVIRHTGDQIPRTPPWE